MLILKRSIRGLLIACFLLFGAMQLHAQAGPFLVCDPYPASQAVTSFTLFWDGSATGVSVPVLTDSTGTYLHFDLAATTAGSHTVKARAKNAWGESADSLPFTFTKSGAPPAPVNIRITTN